MPNAPQSKMLASRVLRAPAAASAAACASACASASASASASACSASACATTRPLQTKTALTALQERLQDNGVPYQLERFLRRGAFGSVFSAHHLKTGEQVAIKTYTLPGDEGGEDEAQMMQLVGDHPHILKLHEAYPLEGDCNEGIIVMDLCQGGELFDVMLEANGVLLPEERVLQYTRDLLLATEYVHKHGFAHLDIKPENVLFLDKERTHLVLCDFGAAEFFRRAPYAASRASYVVGLDDEIRHLDRMVGTVVYASPEVCSGHFSSRSDVWSLGVTVYMMITLARPFESNRTEPLEAQRSVQGKITRVAHDPSWHVEFPKRVREQFSQPLLDFTATLMAPHAEDRPSASEALDVLRDTLGVAVER